MSLKIKKLHPNAIVPSYAHLGDSCFDLYALPADDMMRAHPVDKHAVIFRTGLAFEVPHGFTMLIFSRSGQGFNDATRLSNCVGVIDAPYRGEVKVSLRADGETCRKVQAGDRIAQAMLVAVPVVEIEVVEELSQTERGSGGFGSTGA